MKNRPKIQANFIPKFGAELKIENWTEKLWNSVDLRRKKNSKKSAWKRDFLQLRKYQKDDEIETVLNWYCSNVGGKFVPKVFSASAFRTKFTAIRQAMRTIQLKQSQAPSDVIAYATRNILQWPAYTTNEVNEFISATYSGYSQFLEGLERLTQEEPENNYAKTLLQALHSPKEFTKLWTEDAHGFCCRRRNVRLSNLVWSIRSKHWIQFYAPFLLDWDQSGKQWQKVKEKLSKVWK